LPRALLSAATQNRKLLLRIKDWRRIATRYDKLSRNFLAATTLVAAFYWTKL
jgi:transposase